jgi:hypothetical protein
MRCKIGRYLEGRYDIGDDVLMLAKVGEFLQKIAIKQLPSPYNRAKAIIITPGL